VTRKRETLVPPTLVEHESGVRSLQAEAHGRPYVAHRTLAAAQADPQGIIVFEGDFGGQIYAVARASFVRCATDQLQTLLAEIDAAHWNEPDGARVCFESSSGRAGVAGGMGGGVVPAELWVHPKLNVSLEGVRAVLLGERVSISGQVV
jgi:hypothetical protein